MDFMNLLTWTVIFEYLSTYFSLQVDPGHCFDPAPPKVSQMNMERNQSF